MGLSLLLTASQYDFYRVFVTALGIPSSMKLIPNLDMLARAVLLIFSMSYAVVLMVRGWPDVQLGNSASLFFALFLVSVLLFLLERLSGRYKLEGAEDNFRYLERLSAAMLSRRNFAGPLSAVAVVTVYFTLAAGVATVMLAALTFLSSGADNAAFSYLCTAFSAELLYVLARFQHFKRITSQGWEAAYAASLHATFATTLYFPVYIVYIAMLAARHN